VCSLPICNSHPSAQKEGYAVFFYTSAYSGWTPLGRGSGGRFGVRRFRAKRTLDLFGTHRAFPHALPPSFVLRSVPFASVGLFFSAAAPVKKKTSRYRQKGKTMKLEEVNQQTREAVDFLVAALESGHSAVLTQYLAAMAKFRNYSFGNIMLIARQKPDATNVAGFRAWNSLGRFVRRGEKGISILAPMISNRRKNNASEEQTEDANKSQPRLFGFRAV